MTDTSVPLLDMARHAVRNMSDDEKIKFAVEVCLDVADPTAARPALTFVSERIAQRKRIQAIVDRHEDHLLVTGNSKDNDRVWLRSSRTGVCVKTEGHRATGSMQPADAPIPKAPLYDAHMRLAEEVLLHHYRRQLSLLRDQLRALRFERAQPEHVTTPLHQEAGDIPSQDQTVLHPTRRGGHQ